MNFYFLGLIDLINFTVDELINGFTMANFSQTCGNRLLYSNYS